MHGRRFPSTVVAAVIILVVACGGDGAGAIPADATAVPEPTIASSPTPSAIPTRTPDNSRIDIPESLADFYDLPLLVPPSGLGVASGTAAGQNILLSEVREAEWQNFIGGRRMLGHWVEGGLRTDAANCSDGRGVILSDAEEWLIGETYTWDVKNSFGGESGEMVWTRDMHDRRIGQRPKVIFDPFRPFKNR